MRAALHDVLDRIPGALGAAVVGLDGIPVERLTAQEGFNIDLASAEGIGVVRRASGTLRDLPEEMLEEITITYRSQLMILRSLSADYYLCVVVGPETILGHARYETWRAGQQLRAAIG